MQYQGVQEGVREDQEATAPQRSWSMRFFGPLSLGEFVAKW
jgi:hypothetical protein